MIPGFRDVFPAALRTLRRAAVPFAVGVVAAAAFCALRGALAPSGPRDYAGLSDPDTAAVLRRARGKLADGDRKGAGDIYRDLAAVRPDNAAARLLLGIHLQDVDRDPFAAIGEFNAFLRLAPGSEKTALARERIHACELEIARRLNVPDAAAGAPSGETDPGAEARIRKLADELDSARAATAAARESLAEAVSERDRLKRTNDSLQKQLDAMKGTGLSSRAPKDDLTKRFDRLSEEAGDFPAGPPQPRAGAGAPVQIADYMTYEVKRGDTLWKIAQKAYNDGSRTAEIKAANPGLVGADGSVREGTVLRIPR